MTNPFNSNYIKLNKEKGGKVKKSKIKLLPYICIYVSEVYNYL